MDRLDCYRFVLEHDPLTVQTCFLSFTLSFQKCSRQEENFYLPIKITPSKNLQNQPKIIPPKNLLPSKIILHPHNILFIRRVIRVGMFPDFSHNTPLLGANQAMAFSLL